MTNKIMMRLIAVVCLVNSFAATSASIWLGDWFGTATTANEQTSVGLHIQGSKDRLVASISLNDVGVAGWPVSLIEASRDQLHIELASDSGIQKMDLSFINGALTGKWVEAGKKEQATLYLEKQPVGDHFIEERVFIDGPAGKLGASIIRPTQKGPFPAIVFVHGSGPQPRDTSRFAALRFAELGVASIIYDKRGVAGSEGQFQGLTFEELAADAIAIADYMLSQENISSVGFSGHSQGGWISTLAGSVWKKTGFVITSAGPAVSPAREAHWTVVRAMRNSGANKLAIDEARIVIDNWHHGIRTGNWAAFDKSYAQAQKQTWFTASNLADFSEKPSKQFTLSYNAFADYDPMPALRLLEIPYLAILSPEDESIDSMETKAILEKLEKNNITLKLYAGYDHSMRKLGKKGNRLRWPEHPQDYFVAQSQFISASIE